MRSGFESKVSKMLASKKVKFSYESMTIPYVVERIYKPDFVIEGSDFVIETKGYFTSADRSKLLAVKRQNPDKDIRLWFQRDNWTTSKKKQKYSDWAEKNGFKWHVGDSFPLKWFKKTTRKSS